MKEKLKYLAAVLLAGSILTWFIPLFSVSIINLSVMDIMKVCLGFYSGSIEARMIYGSVRIYLEPFAWCIAGALALIFIEAFLTAVLSKKKAYVISLISCIINCAAVTLVIVLIRIKLNEVRSALILLDDADIIQFHWLPVIIWGSIYFIILCLSIVGICLWVSTERKETKSEEIYLDQIRMLEEENDIRKKYTDEENSETYRSIPQPDDKRSPDVPPVQVKSMPETDYRLDQRREKKEQSGKKILEKSIYNGETEKKFTGAIIGEKGIYAGKVYPLIDKKEIFFRMDNEQILSNPYEDKDNLAGIYFIGKYNEYCVEPYKKNFVFLESGQPLGKDRRYFLPRGTGLYLKDKNNEFTLA